jgi:hypothetical protein
MVTPGGTKVSLYGRLELNSFYEDGINKGALSSKFAPATPKKTADPQGRTGLAIFRTRLGLNLEGPSKEDEPSLKGRFEADFSGSEAATNFNGSSGFRVRQSWGSVGFKDLGLTLLFGQTDDLMAPLDPPSVNPSSLNGAGNIGNRRPQIRLTQALGPMELAVAATHDRLNADTLPVAAPAVQGRLGFKSPASWAGEKANLAVGIGGHFARNEAASDVDSIRTKPMRSYSIAADLSLPLMDILTLTGEFFTGQNLKRYGDGSLSQDELAGICTKKDKNCKEEDLVGVQSTGWWAGLALKLPANFSVGTALGMENVDSDIAKDWEGKGKDKKIGNMFILANLAYNFTSAAKLTLEWTNLATDYAKVANAGKFEDLDGSMNRFELNFRYDFK